MKAIYNLFNTKGQMFALLLGILCIAIILISIFSGLSSSGFDASTDLNAVLKNGGGDGFNFLNPVVALPMALIIIAFAVWVIFGLMRLIGNPKGSLVFLIGIGILVVLFLILYATSEAETTGKIAELVGKNNISENISKVISGGVKSVVTLTIIAFLGIILFEIYNLFK